MWLSADSVEYDFCKRRGRPLDLDLCRDEDEAAESVGVTGGAENFGERKVKGLGNTGGMAGCAKRPKKSLLLLHRDTVSLSYWFGDCFCGSCYPSIQ